MSQQLSVLLLGATGEVGKEIVKRLAVEPRIAQVTLIGRRATDPPKCTSGTEKFIQKIVDFDNLSAHTSDFTGHDIAICALGTTRAKSGAAGFQKVDHDYVVNAAKTAKAAGTKCFSLVSSGAADKNSFYLYLKVKGQVEEEIRDMNFDRLTIYRPGFLLCKRSERRIGERVMQSFFYYVDRWRLYSVETTAVGVAVVRNIFSGNQEPVEVVSNQQIRELAKRPDKT